MKKFLMFLFSMLSVFITNAKVNIEKIDTFLPPNLGGMFNVHNKKWDSFFQKEPVDTIHLDQIKKLSSFQYYLNNNVKKDFLVRKIDFYLESLTENEFQMNARNDFQIYTNSIGKEQFIVFNGCYSPCKYGQDVLFFKIKKGHFLPIIVEFRNGNWLIDSLYFTKKRSLVVTQCSNDIYGNFKRYYNFARKGNKIIDMFQEGNKIPIPILEFLLSQYMNEQNLDYSNIANQMINPRNFVFGEIQLQKIKKRCNKYSYYIFCPILKQQNWIIEYNFNSLKFEIKH